MAFISDGKNTSFSKKALKMNTHFAYNAVRLILLAISNRTEGVIGINWGRQNAQRLIPSMVVDLILQNGVPEARIYSAQEDILKAFAGSEINLTVCIFNVSTIGSDYDANRWVQKRAQWLKDSHVRRVYIGNQAFINEADNKILQDKGFQASAVNALALLSSALVGSGYGELVKVTLPHPFQVLKDNIKKPSEAEFKDSVKEQIVRQLRIITDNHAPFGIDLFPIEIMGILNITDLSFGFPDGKYNHVVKDVNGAIYTNVFDFAYDSFVWALEKVGAANQTIVVSQVGWPTDGYPGASAANAERFFKDLLPMVVSNKGTPKRPGSPIDIFVHSLTDENRNPSNISYSRHWGIYRSNGEPKYKIDLTGQGRDIFPAKAKGIMQMPQRWCVYDPEATKDEDKVQKLAEYACKNADCTSLAPGGSCSELNHNQRLSYTFNMFFQSQFQDENACKFDGITKVVTEDPSTDACVFPVEVVKGQQDNTSFKLGKPPGGDANRVICEMPRFVVIFMCWLLVFAWE